MGVGTMCCRKNPREVFELLKQIKAALPDWVKIHCFGLSIDILKYKEIYDRIDSIDTWAWHYYIGVGERDYRLKGITRPEMEKKLFLDYQRKVEKIINNNHNQSLLKVTDESKKG
ncbi:unnamed protein product [marine sediment metagenome]|uniref:Uncharacterized protein n=1 Tax=marine sediment metagenome TaxID=412755 RepID=X1AA03_9ZZZZ